MSRYLPAMLVATMLSAAVALTAPATMAVAYFFTTFALSSLLFVAATAPVSVASSAPRYSHTSTPRVGFWQSLFHPTMSYTPAPSRGVRFGPDTRQQRGFGESFIGNNAVIRDSSPEPATTVTRTFTPAAAISQQRVERDARPRSFGESTMSDRVVIRDSAPRTTTTTRTFTPAVAASSVAAAPRPVAPTTSQQGASSTSSSASSLSGRVVIK